MCGREGNPQREMLLAPEVAVAAELVVEEQQHQRNLQSGHQPLFM